MAGDRTHILLVDDKPERLLSYEAILERLGQDLVRAASGDEALERLAELDFAAILLDVNMPGMDGFETARRIRKHPRGDRTPIIFVTGVHVSDLDRIKGYELGAADYVYVPVVPEILRAKVAVMVQLYLQRLELSRLNERLVATNAELGVAHDRLKVENTRELQKLNQSLELAVRQLRSEIHERRRAEERLREAAQRKDEFISILAHELRNPLAAIQSGVELLRMSELSPDKATWARDLLGRQLAHLVRLIDDLLDVSRVTTGRVHLQLGTIDLNGVVAETVDATRPSIEGRRHELRLALLGEPAWVRADSVRLTQVFANLLTNASKYMEPGGTIEVGVELDPVSSQVLTRVRDQGAGLASDMLERVFDLFTQAKPSASRTESGLGIGLALVRSLVELHGGKVRAASEGPGRGCEFVVALPLASQPAAEPAVKAPPEPAGARRSTEVPLRLLIIDDNVDAAHGLAQYLQASSEHELRLAHTGTSGVTMALEFEPDVVLLDIGLPDIDGYEVARRLRQHADLDGVPLIAMTGFGGAPDRERAREAGFDHFLVKPVAFPALRELLAGCGSAPATARHA